MNQQQRPSCEFCEIIAGIRPARVLFQDLDLISFVPLNPATRGHILIVPIRHVCDLRELDLDEAQLLGAAAVRVGAALRAALNPAGLNIIQSNGAAATQTVDHLHLHLVPRYDTDRMILEWPSGPAESDSSQDQTLALVRARLPTPVIETPGEDRRQHLTFIQNVITRMSQASTSAKTWLLPIVTAAYGYGIAQNRPAAALLGVVAVLVFALLDANYLKQERSFRSLYHEVATGGTIPNFALNPALAGAAGPGKNYWPDKRDVWSWSVAPVYGPLALAGILLVLAQVGLFDWALKATGMTN